MVVAGAVAQKPGRGGHAWVFLQYLLGFVRLGYDVVFLDRLDAEGPERARGLGWVDLVMRRFGLGDAYAVLGPDGASLAGLSRDRVVAHLERSSLVLNVNGFLTDPDLLGRAPLRVYLDIDPGFPQIWRASGLHDAFRGHDAFATFGERIGRPGCDIPTGGLRWVATRPPVVLREWPVALPPDRPVFTSVASWRGAYGPLDHAGRTYGLRVHEFRPLAGVPRRVAARFELALDIHAGDEGDAKLLRRGGWSLLDPTAVAGDPWSYRRFIRGSSAEFMVAKGMYVTSRSGWFSDRSACYLSTGRPVVAQDTGSRLPVGAGLLTFRDPDDAVRAAAEVLAEYEHHARAARRLAEDHLDSDRVLTRLLANLGVAPPRRALAPSAGRPLAPVPS